MKSLLRVDNIVYTTQGLGFTPHLMQKVQSRFIPRLERNHRPQDQAIVSVNGATWKILLSPDDPRLSGSNLLSPAPFFRMTYCLKGV